MSGAPFGFNLRVFGVIFVDGFRGLSKSENGVVSLTHHLGGELDHGKTMRPVCLFSVDPNKLCLSFSPCHQKKGTNQNKNDRYPK